MTDGARSRELRGCAEPECVDRALDLLAELWLEVDGVSDEDRMAVELAVAEVMGNIVEHSRSQDPVDVVVRVLVHPGEVVAEFEDTGDPVRLRVPLDEAEMPGAAEETGRGLALAGTVMDELGYSRTDGANRWRLVRRRRP